MRLNYYGTLLFEKELTPEEVSEVSAIIKHNKQEDEIQVDEFSISVEDSARFPFNDAFYDWLESHGNDLEEESELRYYGDYDGALRWENGKFEDYESMPICDLADQYLIRELEYRKYDISSLLQKNFCDETSCEGCLYEHSNIEFCKRESERRENDTQSK